MAIVLTFENVYSAHPGACLQQVLTPLLQHSQGVAATQPGALLQIV